MKTKFYYVLLIMFGIMIASCEKEGPEGPKGDTGEQGTAGTQGATGPQGPTGPQGNANVHIYEKDIAGLVWTNNTTYSSLTISAPNVLTAATLENNTILVYVYTSDFNGWGAVPYATERNIRVTAEIGVGYVRLKRDQNGTSNTQSWHNKIRLVVIKNTATDVLGRVAENKMQYLNYPATRF